jgi:hypothetical protein
MEKKKVDFFESLRYVKKLPQKIMTPKGRYDIGLKKEGKEYYLFYINENVDRIKMEIDEKFLIIIKEKNLMKAGKTLKRFLKGQKWIEV